MTSGADELRQRAIAAHGEAWRLLLKSGRTPVESRAMVEAARDSLRLFEEAGTPAHRQRGNWIMARVLLEVGSAKALDYAKRTLDLTRENREALADFDFAFAEEIAARAFAFGGESERALEHYVAAKSLGQAIRNPADREEFFRQFGSSPWFGLEAG